MKVSPFELEVDEARLGVVDKVLALVLPLRPPVHMHACGLSVLVGGAAKLDLEEP